MRKYVILDGCDHAGKTYVAKTLAKAYPDQIDACKFPSDALAENPVFLDVVKMPTLENRKAWLDLLEKDVIDTLTEMLKKPVVLIDRLWVSTLLYQGDGLQSFPDPFQFERIILDRFAALFDKLGIALADIHTVVFRYPFVCVENKNEKNPAKLILDQRMWHYMRKLATLIKNIDTCPQLKSELWKNTRFIAEDTVRNAATEMDEIPAAEIANIQQRRVEALAETLGLSPRP